MATTLTIDVDNTDAKKGLKELDDGFDAVDTSIADVNAALQKQTDELENVRDEMRKVKKEGDAAFGKPGDEKNGEGKGILGMVGASVIAAWAFKESIMKVVEGIRAMADAGDKDMQRVITKIDALKMSVVSLGIEVANIPQRLGDYAEGLGDLIDGWRTMFDSQKRYELQLERDINLRERLLAVADEQYDAEKSLNDLLTTGTLESVRDTLAVNREMLTTTNMQELTAQEILEITTRIGVLRRREDALLAEQTEKMREQQKIQEDMYREATEARYAAANQYRENAIKQETATETAAREKLKHEEELARTKKYNAAGGLRDQIMASRRERAEAIRIQELRKQHIEELVKKQLAARERLKEGMEGDDETAGKLVNQASQFKALYQRIVQTRIDAAIKKAEAAKGDDLTSAERGRITRSAVQSTKEDFAARQRGKPGRGQTGADYMRKQNEFQEELKRATAANANQMLSTMVKNNDITRSSAKALGKAAEELLKQEDEMQDVEREVEHINRILDDMSARNSRRGGAGRRG